MDTHDRSIPGLFRDLLLQLTTLLRMEGQLARAEMSEKLGRATRGVALVLGGAVLMMPALVILLEAIVAALVDAGLEAHWAALIVGGLALILGGIVLFAGVKAMKLEELTPRRTIDNLQRDVSVATHQLRSDDEIQRAA